eukprot:UN2382
MFPPNTSLVILLCWLFSSRRHQVPDLIGSSVVGIPSRSDVVSSLLVRVFARLCPWAMGSVSVCSETDCLLSDSQGP